MYYSFREESSENIRKTNRKEYKYIYGRKKLKELKSFFLTKLNDKSYLEKTKIKKNNFSSKIPFFKNLKDKMEKKDFMNKESYLYNKTIKKLFSCLEEKNLKIFTQKFDLIFENKVTELNLNFEKSKRKLLIKNKKSRLFFNILIFFFKENYDLFLKKIISQNLFFRKTYFLLEEFVILIKSECFEKGIFLENVLKTIFFKYKVFIKKIKNNSKKILEEKLTFYNKKIFFLENLIKQKNKKIDNLENEIIKKNCERKIYLNDKKIYKKKIKNYNSFIISYKLKKKIFHRMQQNLKNISSKIKFFNKIIIEKDSIKNSKIIEQIGLETKTVLSVLENNFKNFNTIKKDENFIKQEFMAFDDFKIEKIYEDKGINFVVKKFDKSTYNTKIFKINKFTQCIIRREDKKIQCDIRNFFNTSKIKEELEKQKKYYLDIIKNLKIYLKSSKKGFKSRNKASIESLVIKNNKKFSINLKTLKNDKLEELTNKTQINNNFIFRKSTFFNKKFIFDTKKGLIDDCCFIDKSICFFNELKFENLNCNKKLREICKILLKTILTNSKEKDFLVVFWKIFKKNNNTQTSDFKKFSTLLKSLEKRNLYENKTGMVFYLLNLKNFNHSFLLKNLLFKLFHSLNLQLIKKSKKNFL